MALPRDILEIDTIYLEPAVESYTRGREVLARYPTARRITVPSHNNIPTLYGNEGNAEDWLRIKQHVLVLGRQEEHEHADHRAQRQLYRAFDVKRLRHGLCLLLCAAP